MRFIGVISLLLLSTLACGKSAEEEAAEKAAAEAREAEQALEKAAESAGKAGAQGMQDFAKAMEGLGTALGGSAPDGKPVDPVGFQILQTALPQMAGWERGEPSGERMALPVPFSQAEANYTRGEADIDVKIVDSAYSGLLIAPWTMFLASGYEKQSSEGYEKSLRVGEHPGWERWDRDDKDGELNLVIGKRFLVTVEGSNIDDTKVLHQFATAIDAARLK